MNIAELLPVIDGKLAKLQQARKLISDSDPAFAIPAVGKRRGRPPGSGKPFQVKSAGTRTMSEAGRARTVAAQKKRWAESRSVANAA